MTKIAKTLLAALLAATISVPAFAGSSPGLRTGQVPTAAQWNSYFIAKQDELNYTPVNKAGDTMGGPLITNASTGSAAGFRLPAGTAPSVPTNGDLWTTSAGIFVRIGGVTIGPLSGATSTSFAGTSPIGVTFPAGVVTYAFDFSVANTWTATQTMRTILAGTTNTYDVGTSAAAAAYRTIYAGTSFVGPIGTFTTSVAAGGCTIGANALCATGTANISGATTIGGALTYGGVTLANSVTGTGSMVLATAPSVSSLTVTTAFTATGLVANASLANMAAFTLKGNVTSGSAVPTDFTIGGLTNKSSPGTTDILLLQDVAASGALKYCTLAQCIGAVASGVTSIAGNTGAFTLANGIDNSTNQIQLTAARRTLPTVSKCLSSGTGCSDGGFGGTGTFTTPANALWLEVIMVGGGGGGAAGTGSSSADGGAGGHTCWNTTGAACTTPVYQAGGGTPGDGLTGSGLGGAGGTVTGSGTCNLAVAGGHGAPISPTGGSVGGGAGGASALGGNGSGGGVGGASAGTAGAANTGGGGGGGSSIAGRGNDGGGAGAYCRVIIPTPAGTYTYSVGAAGALGAAGAGGTNGGAGGVGGMWVIAHYGS